MIAAMLKVVISLFVCYNVFGLPMDKGHEDFVLTRKFIDFLKKSGDRIVIEAKELTNDLQNMVNAVENSTYFFMVDYKDVVKKNKKLNEHSGKIKEVSTTPRVNDTTNTVLPSLTTEKESSIIVGQTATGVDQESSTIIVETVTETPYIHTTKTNITEPTTDNQTMVLKNHSSSAFNSLLLQKIQEVAETMKKNRASLEFSTTWTTQDHGQEEIKNHPRIKRQIDLTTIPNEIETATVLQSLQSDERNECISRWDLEQHKFSEKQHLDGLQKELEKMEELIAILRQQQRILDNMSDIDEKYYKFLNNSVRAGNIAEQQRLLQLLEILNNKLSSNTTNSTESFDHIQEIARLKFQVEQLKMAMEKLPTDIKKVEKKLSKEIEDVEKDVYGVKRAVWHLTNRRKLSMSNETLRASENDDFVDPHYIQELIDAITIKSDEIQQNPDTNNLMDLQEETEHLEEMINESLNASKLSHNEDIVEQLEDEENQLQRVKKVVDGIIKSKQIEKQFLNQASQSDDFLLETPLHKLKISHVDHIAKRKSDKNASESMKTENLKRSSQQSQPRSSSTDEIIKFLKEVSNEPSTDNSSFIQVVDPQQAELQNKIMQLQRRLQAEADKDRLERDKEKQIKFIADRIQTLENADFSEVQSKSFSDDQEKRIIVKLLKKILRQLRKSGREFDESDTDIELAKLADAINRLRPNDNEIIDDIEDRNDMSAEQFDFLLSRLLTRQNSRKPAPTAPFTPQQMDFLINKCSQQTPIFPMPFPATRYVNYQPNYALQPFPAPPTNNLFRDYSQNFASTNTGYSGFNQQQLDANPEKAFPNGSPYTKQKIEELRQQIFNLQNAISTLDNPNFVRKPEDEETIYKLEQEINNLKNIVNGLNQYPEGSVNLEGNYQNGNKPNNVPLKPDTIYDKPRLNKRDISTDTEDEEAEKFMQQAANFLRNFVPKEEAQPELQQRSSENYDYLKQKLLDLEKQLGKRKMLLENKRKAPDDYTIRNSGYDNLPNFGTSNKLYEIKKAKKLSIFEKIITKIVDIVVDKIAITIPIVIKKLFGITTENLADYNPDYSYGSVQSLKNLGIFSYLPLIILKFVDGFTYFINILKKNKFIKSFLVPALVLVGVLGFIVFLVWWLQPDSNSQYGNLNYVDEKTSDNNMYGYSTDNNYGSSRSAISNIKNYRYM